MTLLSDLKKAPISLSESIQTAGKLVLWIQQYHLGNPSEPWLVSRRLMRHDMPASARTAGFELYVACVQSRADLPSVVRFMFFNAIETDFTTDDFDLQIQALSALSNGGRDISGFDLYICALVTKWIDRALSNLDTKQQIARRTTLLNNAMRHQDLRSLITYITSVAKFNFSILDEESISSMVNKIVLVCKRTGDEDDIRESLSFFDAIIRYGFIPVLSLPEVINVICSVYKGLDSMRPLALSVMLNLLRSHMAIAAFQALKQNIQGVRSIHDDVILGALGLLTSAWTQGVDDHVIANLDKELIFQAYKDGLLTEHKRDDRDQVKLDTGYLNSLLQVIRTDRVSESFAYDDWSIPFDIMLIATRSLDITRAVRIRDDVDVNENDLAATYAELLSTLEAKCSKDKAGLPRHRLAELWSQLHFIIPPSSTRLLVQFYAEELCCYPSDPNWLGNIGKLGKEVYLHPTQTEEMRLLVLQQFSEIVALVAKSEASQTLFPTLLQLFSSIDRQQNLASSMQALELVTRIAVDGLVESSRSAIELLKSFALQPREARQASVHSPRRRGSDESQFSVVSGLTKSTASAYRGRFSAGVRSPKRASSPVSVLPNEADTTNTLASVAARGLTEAFMNKFTTKPDSSGQYIYSIIVEISSSSAYHRQARLQTIALLARVRADSERYLYLDHEALQESSMDLEGAPAPNIPAFDTTAQYFGIRSRYTCDNDSEKHEAILSMRGMLHMVSEIIKHESDWLICSAILDCAKLQLSNKHLFQNCDEQIHNLRSTLCEQLSTRSTMASLSSDVKREDVMISLIQVLTTVIGYHQLFSKVQQDEIVAALQAILMRYQKATPACVHILTICAYETPLSTAKSLASILVRLSQLITSTNASIPILEFLSALAKLPDQYVNFREEDYRRVFGVALQHIQHANALSRDSSNSGMQDPLSQPIPIYVLTLAFDALYAWFLALKLPQRPKYLNWIVDGLLASNPGGKGLDERGQVCYDFLMRFCYSNAEIKSMAPGLQEFETDQSSTKSWLHGNAVLTMRTMNLSGLTELIVRRPSGTVSFLCKPNSDVEALSIISSSDARAILSDEVFHGPTESKIRNAITFADSTAFTPSHMLLQIVAAPDLHSNDKPCLLPDDPATKRALATFDRIPVVDFHKIGIVYVGRGQTAQKEILANTFGSPEYVEFLEELGELVRLKGNTDIYTGGLDSSSDEDGEFAYTHREKITQTIFHTCTLMPTRPDIDPDCNRKKAHIGNDFVNIIWNNSNRPYNPETISSEFNFVNIVVSPDAFQSTRAITKADAGEPFFKVKVLPHKNLPSISPATEWRLISKSKLPGFVRTVATQCNVYAQVHHAQGVSTSMWRQRLEKITQLRSRVLARTEESSNENEKEKPGEEKGGAGYYFTAYN